MESSLLTRQSSTARMPMPSSFYTPLHSPQWRGSQCVFLLSPEGLFVFECVAQQCKMATFQTKKNTGKKSFQRKKSRFSIIANKCFCFRFIAIENKKTWDEKKLNPYRLNFKAFKNLSNKGALRSSFVIHGFYFNGFKLRAVFVIVRLWKTNK